MTDFIIRQALPDDAPAILELINDLAHFEQMPNGPKIGVDMLKEDLKRGAVYVKLAFHGIKCVGMVLYYLAYSSWEGQHMHMEDLYIRPEFQRKGLAREFVKALAKESMEKGFTRINWSVLNWNTPALEFYKSLNAINLHESEGWLSYRLDGPRIRLLAEE